MNFKEYIREGKSDFWKTVEGNSDYLIRQNGDNKYEVAVFTRGDAPTKVYNCKGNEKHISCDCPSRKSCKHQNLVKDWIKAGKPENQFFKGSKEKVDKFLKGLK